jgi:hypothetical protein
MSLLLVVYVDDFKLAGPVASVTKAWTMIKSCINIENPSPIGQYLGCEHRPVTIAPRHMNASAVPYFAYPHAHVLCPDTRGASSATSVAAPGGKHENCSSPAKLQVKQNVTAKDVAMNSPVARAIQWDMSGFLKQCLDVYTQLAGPAAPKFRKVVTPFLDQKAESEEDLKKAGALAPVASKILMKVLYAARMARPDLLRPTCYLATRVTKWTVQCDKMLYRMMCYIYSGR